VGAPGGQVARKADIAPVWSFREESLAQRKLDDAKALAEYQARLASQPMQYVGPIDDAANARAAMAQQRTANNLAAALGGPFVAAPMLTARAAGLDEHQVEQAGMLGLAAMDAAGVKSGGMATRLASGSRRAGVPITPQRLDPYFTGDSWTPVRSWRLVEDGGRYFTVGSNGSKFSAMGEYNFVTINGETYVAKQQVGGHYDISMGAGSVDYAGIVRFGRQDSSRGFIKEWSNNSGHYKPSPDDAIQAGLPPDMFKPHR
jgi:hypothetical protein